jgi:hypothetical protein
MGGYVAQCMHTIATMASPPINRYQTHLQLHTATLYWTAGAADRLVPLYDVQPRDIQRSDQGHVLPVDL